MKENTVTIKLEYPVKLVDCELKEVTMRRPKVKDLLTYNVDDKSYGLKEEAAWIADLCNLVPEDFDEFDAVDFDKLQEQLMQFRSEKNKKGNKKDSASVDANRKV